MKRAAIYVRVSSDDRNPDLQLRECRKLCKGRGYEITREHIDQGFSGSLDRRLALDELMNDAKRKRFEVLVFWKTDRLARSLMHLLTLSGELEAFGIDLISVTDPIDTSTPHGKAFFQMSGVFAELERALILERVQAGIAAAKARGQTFGRPRVELDTQRLLDLRAQGLSLRKIAAVIGSNTGSVRRRLAEATT